MSIKKLLSSKAGRYFAKYYNSYLDEYTSTEDKWPLSFLELLSLLKFEVNFLSDTCIEKKPHSKSKLNKLLSKFILQQYKKNYGKVHYYRHRLYNSEKSIIRTNYSDKRFLTLKKYKSDQLLHTRLSYEHEINKRLSLQSWDYIIIVEDNINILKGLFKFNKNNNLKTASLLGKSIHRNLKKCKNVINILSNKPKKLILNEGKILINNEKNKIGKQISIIDKLQKRIPNSLFYKIEPTLHQHHFIFFVRKRPSNKIQYEAIYYHQKPFTNTISPIVIQEKKNIQQIINITKYYFENNMHPLSNHCSQEIPKQLLKWMNSI